MENRSDFSKVKRTGSIDYMLRTAQQHHAQLSFLADQKANIMVAANTVLITVATGSFDFEKPVWALISLLIFSFFALLFAILAVYPSIRSGLSQSSVQKQPNLLFFGTFSKYEFREYASMMGRLMQKDETVYEAMVRDLYQIGVTLKETKYKYIRISYRIFFVGLALSLIIFLGQLSDTMF